MTKQQYIDKGMVHLEMTKELKQYCIELAKTNYFVSADLIENDYNRFCYCYELTCKKTHNSYYHILDGIIGSLSKEDIEELMLEVKGKEQFMELTKYMVENATIGNPNQYFKLCYPVYEDMVRYGLDSFEVSLVYAHYYTGSLWAWGNIMLNYPSIKYNRTTYPYNKISNWKFSGIKCVETQEIFSTPGNAARAVGLKSKTSILKALNDYNRTAAKCHWTCLDRP